MLSPLAVLVLWESLSRSGIVDARIIPPPSAVAVTMASMFRHDGLGGQAFVTLGRFLGGFALGAVPGIFLGLTMGLYRAARVAFAPLVAVIYPLPHIAIFPIILILVGQNERANIVMIAFGPFFTMAITAMGAVLAIEPIHREVAKSFETSPRDLYTRVVLPATLPSIFSGLRIALGAALISTIAVEFLVSDTGIGHIIWNSWQTLSLGQSMAGLVLTGIIGVASYALLDAAERRLVPWR
ncbi:MAG: ABC transporter permease [bacterium]|nr:ABC transporter permease [bacterium]